MRSFRWRWLDVVSRNSIHFGRSFEIGVAGAEATPTARFSVMRLSVSDLQGERSGEELANCAVSELACPFPLLRRALRLFVVGRGQSGFRRGSSEEFGCAEEKRTIVRRKHTWHLTSWRRRSAHARSSHVTGCERCTSKRGSKGSRSTQFFASHHFRKRGSGRTGTTVISGIEPPRMAYHATPTYRGSREYACAEFLVDDLYTCHYVTLPQTVLHQAVGTLTEASPARRGSRPRHARPETRMPAQRLEFATAAARMTGALGEILWVVRARW